MIHICFGRWLGDPHDLGKGTSADPYRIYTPQQLYSVRNDLQGSYKLMADLDMTAWCLLRGWIPIGDYDHPFIGEFDGNDHSISNISIINATRDGGVFGAVQNCNIHDLAIVDFNYSSSVSVSPPSSYSCGAVAAIAKGSCLFNKIVVDGGSIETTYATAGGIVGYSSGGPNIISRCKTSITIDASIAGGIAGTTTGDDQVYMCCSYGDITSTETVAGGIAGIWAGNGIYDCYVRGEITGTGYCGGIAALTIGDGRIQRCYSANTITGTTYSAGIGGYGANPDYVAQCLWNKTINSTHANPDNTGTIGYTTAEMQVPISGTIYESFGFAGTIWTGGTGVYPTLQWEP
jgi:hypothetical protein